MTTRMSFSEEVALGRRAFERRYSTPGSSWKKLRKEFNVSESVLNRARTAYLSVAGGFHPADTKSVDAIKNLRDQGIRVGTGVCVLSDTGVWKLISLTDGYAVVERLGKSRSRWWAILTAASVVDQIATLDP